MCFKTRMTFAEWAGGIRRDVHRLETEVVRPFAAFGGNDDPAAGDRIFAQLRHFLVSSFQHSDSALRCRAEWNLA